MRVAAAFLCDAANVREGLPNILSAGVTQLNRETYPAPLGVSLFYMVEVLHSEAREPHKITIELSFADRPEREPLARVEGGWETVDATADERLPIHLPVIVNLHQVAIPEAGYYEFKIDLEGVGAQAILLRANQIGNSASETEVS